MRKIIIYVTLIMVSIGVKAQNDIDVLLAAGVEDAQRFAKDYLAPGTNGIMHSMNANWFNSAKVKPLGGFEISVIANAVMIKDEHKAFTLNTSEYNNVQFVQGPNVQSVASVLGENEPDIFVEVQYDDPIFGTQTTQFELPQGIGSGSKNLLPTAFIQGAVGLSSGLELKARFVPNIKTDDVSLSMYGAGIQMEFTDWLPASKLWPIAVSGLVAYNHIDGSYDLTGSSGIEGENQRIENDTNTWLFQLIASTKLPVINFYGGIGYVNGESQSDLLGNYRVTNGLLTSETIVDPFSVKSEVTDVRASIGTRLKLGFFRLNAEYHISEYHAFSVGVNFGFR
ncbi:hypothetical protein DFR65_10595 [Oceanihabitans sediminis]|uniref:Uncharacterized protein n=1 Tax=Oceanihabitans sediminis TaxID=1812012 RepID=A0A368P3X1_9FLAO|nr:DUF6588 family protein [Oceanihabitans sediminis]RBP29869.1 hypothetical protein DFR65_10595 [Oceanihabitans sediminis]RCU57208.1 hypothetical protein DU428_09705 [Oceanihabitans sediminis]